ncbi:MAG: hypothetical protein KDE03_15780 [Rhodobacteraceae bacterium]|nr:hypothetical protein [Paracoccaceae bacterium]
MKAGVAGLVPCLAAGPGMAEEQRGNRGQVDGFYAATLMTSDADWREKWTSVAPEVSVDLTEVTVLKVGERVSILAFFANPEVKDGAIDIHCDLKVVRPDGSEVTQPEGQCAAGPIEGDATDIRLTGMVIEVVGGPDDARGTWRAEIGVTDANRGVRVPLVLQFGLVDGEGAP